MNAIDLHDFIIGGHELTPERSRFVEIGGAAMKPEHEELCAVLDLYGSKQGHMAADAIRELSAEVERLMHDLTRAGEIGAELATRAERAEAELAKVKARNAALELAWSNAKNTVGLDAANAYLMFYPRAEG